MIKLINQSVRQTILWSVVAGVMYPVVMTIFAQVAFHNQANGSLVEKDGKIIGSALLAQQFQGTNYFWPRPSACTYGTGPTGLVASGGSNLGPLSANLLRGTTKSVGLTVFAAGPFWKAAKARLMPRVEEATLPLSLAERFGVEGADGLVRLRGFLAPITAR